MTISIRATRSFITNAVSLDGPTLVNQGTSNTYNITDYNRFSTYSATTSVGTVSITDAVLTLVVPTTTATQIKITVSKDNTTSVFNIAVGANAIVTPTITSPTEGAVGVNLSPTLASTTFTTAPAGVTTHASSQWQVATDAGFTSIVFDSGVTTTNKTQITVPALALNTAHYARVRYTGVTLGTTTWSTVLNFTTTNQYVATPSLWSSDNVLATGETPVISGSSFTVVNGSDTHSATDWQLVRPSDSTVIWSSVGDTTNKTSIKIPNGVMDISSNYRVRVRYSGAILGYGGWAELNFTTTSQFSYGEYMLFEGTALRNGVYVPAPAGIHMFGRKLSQFIEIPNQPSLPPFPATTSPYYTSLASLIAGNQAFRPDGNYLVMTGYRSNCATVYKRQNDSFDRLQLPITPDNNYVNCAKWVNNDILLVGSGMNMNVYCQIGDQFVKLPNAPYTHSRDYQSNENSWGMILVHPSGQYVTAMVCNASDYASSYIATWKISGTGISTTFTLVRGGTRSTGRTTGCITWTADGTRLFIGGSGSTVSVIYKWESEVLTQVWAPTHGIDAWAAAFSPDARYLAVQDSDEVYVYQKVEGTETYTFLKIVLGGDNGSSNSQYRKSVQFTADGTLLLGMSGEYQGSGGITKQRLGVFDATTPDFNPVPALDMIVQNGSNRIQLYPFVPGSM